jgi:amidohydrolase
MQESRTNWIKIRQEFHQNPEVSGNEKNTALKVVEILKTLHPTRIVSQLGGHGVAAVYDSGKTGPAVLFRCELDALPIQEINNFAYKSTNQGVSHKCGHDGHLTGLLAFAEKLHLSPPKSGKAILLFQPAEENGEGAEAILADPKFKKIEPDMVFSYHNLPGYQKSKIVYKPNSFTSAVKSIIIKLHGKTAHAGEPEFGENPAAAISKIMLGALALDNNHPEKEDFTIVTPIHINMGEVAYGISAGYGEVHLTIRSWTSENLQKLSDEIVEIAKTEADKVGLHPEIEFTQQFHANQNDDGAMEILKKSISNSGLNNEERPYPFKWGEDFGLFTQRYPGAMFGIGSGEDCPALHNPDYDFPDELIETGSDIFNHILKTCIEA